MELVAARFVPRKGAPMFDAVTKTKRSGPPVAVESCACALRTPGKGKTELPLTMLTMYDPNEPTKPATFVPDATVKIAPITPPSPATPACCSPIVIVSALAADAQSAELAIPMARSFFFCSSLALPIKNLQTM